MHDILPLKLFAMENLLKLFESGEKAATAFWFPISLSITAISCKSLSLSDRSYLLETAFWFLVFYKEIQDSEEQKLRQRKYLDDLHVSFYTNDLLIEMTNTLHSHIQLLHTLRNFSFDRNSTTPLEHKFGNARLRAHDVNTIKRFLRNISIMQSVDQLKEVKKMTSFGDTVTISGRQNSFGVFISEESRSLKETSVFDDQYVYNETDSCEVYYSPQAFAKSILCYSEFNVDYGSKIDPDAVIDWGFCHLSDFSFEKNPLRAAKKQMERNILKAATFGVVHKTKAQTRICDLSINKRNHSRRIVIDFLTQNFGEDFDNDDIQKVINFIREINGKSFPVPKIRTKTKDKLIDFLTEHMGAYWEQITEMFQ